ncbi:hypothetical protein [Actinacidiphila yeochonensis]|uniref:hypothetical protein n=1 Tax=Actinacidiphila yeochonensis TaxID=89050 RepID=UPI00056AC80A|nr:hypothetical protein [Actinacidiphila yeochonensis]
MSGPVNALVILAVIGLVVARQLRPTAVGGRRWWLIPAVLAVFALRDSGGIIDRNHQHAAVALFAAELVVAAVTGVLWALTTRVWREADGSAMAQGTKATAVVWVLGIAVRVGLYAIGSAAGVHQGSGTVMLAVAAALLIRGGTLLRRTREVEPSYRTAP